MIKTMRFFERLMHIIILNILWFVGTIVGLVFFGVMPASYALDKTFSDNSLFEPHSPIMPIVKKFFSEYKTGFIKMNLIGIIYSILISILLMDLYIIQFNHNLNLLLVPTMMLLTYLIISISYLIAVVNQTKGSLLEKAKLIILAPLLNMRTSLKILIYLLISFFVLKLFMPAFILLFPSLYIKLSSSACKTILSDKKLIINIY